MLRYQNEAAGPAVAHSRAAGPFVTFVVQINAPEFQEWRNGIIKELERLENLMRASRELKITDNGE
jgi:hypothetical protein